MGSTSPDGIPYVDATQYGNSADFPDVDQEQAESIQALITELRGLIDDARAEAVPIGFIGEWAGLSSNIPSGWLLCNGQPSGSAAYAAATGYANTPNLVNRFIVGAGPAYSGNPTSLFSARTEGGGVANGSITLSTAQMPVHNHGSTYSDYQNGTHYHLNNFTISGGAHQHEIHLLDSGPFDSEGADGSGFDSGPQSGWNNYAPNGNTIQGQGSHSHSVYANTNSANAYHRHYVGTSNAGSGSAINVLPHYYALCYITKVS